MTTLDDWKALLADVDAATGPDREIDLALHLLLEPTGEIAGWINHPPPETEISFTEGDTYWKFNAAWPTGGASLTFAKATGSLDAVTALIEREMPELVWYLNSYGEAKITDGGEPWTIAEAKKPDLALALLSAFIRARIAAEQSEAAA